VAIQGLSANVSLDHNVNPVLAVTLRSLGYDVLVPEEAGMALSDDEEHLQRAWIEQRVFITHDLGDFRTLAITWNLAGRSHAGILIAAQSPILPFREFVRSVIAVLDSRTADEFIDQVTR
jgi:uncharacterized protein with PIN domain